MPLSSTIKTHLVFRTDATIDTGLGHLMRCFGLAQCARSMGLKTSFISNIQSDSFFIEVTEKEKIALIRIPSSHPHPDDLRSTEKYLQKINNQNLWVVLDGYHLDETYQKRLKDMGVKIMVIDDTSHLSNYEADVILNPNLYAKSLNYLALPHTLKLFGTNFLLFRNDIVQREKSERPITDVATKILVTMGGSDPVNFTGKVVEALHLIMGYSGKIKIVLGPLNRHAKDIESRVESTRLDIQLIKDPAKFAELITWADMGITAAGTSTWEMGLLGLPLITVSIAENQNKVGEVLKQHNAALHLGWHEGITIENMADAVRHLIYDHEKRRRFSLNQRHLIDGRGASRVVNLIEILTTKQVPTSICTIRCAIESDCLTMWHLANDPLVRKNSFQNHFISMKDHRTWFHKKIRSEETLFQILEIESVIAGQIRYDLVESFVELSFSIAAPFRGMGLGKALIEKTWKDACRALQAKGVRGKVKKHNLPSVKSFLNADFNQVQTERINGEECLIFEKQYDIG